MAQPVFDEHPLKEYFEESGETSEPMPGDFMSEPSGDGAQSPWTTSTRLVPSLLSRIHMPPSLLQTIDSAFQLLSTPKHHHPHNSFAERFKYDVISSSLLSASLSATPNPIRRSFGELPGVLNATSGEHSRTSSTTAVQPDDEPSSHHARNGDASLDWDLEDMKAPVGVVSVGVVALAAGYEFFAYLLFALALYMARAVKTTPEKADDPTSLTLDALNELVSAGNIWDSAVNEAMQIVEKEERNPSPFYGPTSANSPLASLRVALQSSLHMTQSQCDSVRELLSALTSPVQLSQLSEMYAPPSPQKPSFASLEHTRPLSDPVASWRRRSLPPGIDPTTPSNKRATWGGPSSSHSPRSPRSPKSPLFTERDRSSKRRSQLGVVFSPEKFLLASSSASASAPPSPLTHRVLQDVQEEESSDSELPYANDENVFGVAAMDLRRKRRESGMEAFGILPPSYSSHLGHSPSHSSHQSLSSFLTPSRFTLNTTTRHPLSLSALHLALHGALAAKRYACSHLLALRFEEDAEDAAYWEDVRSVMALLTSTFADSSARLLAALDEAEKRRMKDERPSTESLVGSSRDNSVSPDPKTTTRMKSMAEMCSFAPMPSHLTRFAAHVDALSSALNDAREHLESCVASLKEPVADAPTGPAAAESLDDVFSDPSSDANPTLAAYDRFRRELGFALRECERGRERLLDVIASSKPTPQSDSDDDNDATPLPALAHSASSEDSTGADSVGSPKDSPLETPIAIPEQSGQAWDDASEHLLLSATSEHLPPPGIEQVFEGDSSAAAYTRERSKLSREERIRLVKARRESGAVFAEQDLDQETPRKVSRESWGPGGEVVQELKDVIWQVGERRRKMRASTTPEPETEVPEVRLELIDIDSADAGSEHSIHPSGLALEETAVAASLES